MMASKITQDWFTEICEDSGIAFSLKIKEKLHQEQTPFQHIAIYDTTHFGKLMVIDGCIMLSSKDNFLYHEMMAHTVLMTHPNPKTAIIIGGGDCGTLKEVLKHPTIERVIQIDIDEKVTRLSQEYFPELCTSNHDARATLLFEDGIEWIKQTDDDFADIIIVDSTDPIGPAKGLFNANFYSQCRRVLKANGLFVQQSESPLIHQDLIKQMHLALTQAGFNTTKTFAFPQTVYPSGWWSGTMAGSDLDLTNFRKDQTISQKINSKYYTSSIHQGAISQFPLLDNILKNI